MGTEGKRFGLSAFWLKVIACVTMLVDHVGAYLLTDVEILRIIGRLAFPIFAFFIAEGCRYTRNRLKRFLLVFGLALICEVVFFIFDRKITGTVLLTFSCSILIIYALQLFKHTLARGVVSGILLGFLALLGATTLGYAVSECIPIDYGFAGILLPVFASLLDYREGEAPDFLSRLDRFPLRLALFAVGVLAVWFFRGRSDLQLWSILALIPLALYNGRPGFKGFKYWFYIFYPAHLVIIWLIGKLIAA